MRNYFWTACNFFFHFQMYNQDLVCVSSFLFIFFCCWSGYSTIFVDLEFRILVQQKQLWCKKKNEVSIYLFLMQLDKWIRCKVKVTNTISLNLKKCGYVSSCFKRNKNSNIFEHCRSNSRITECWLSYKKMFGKKNNHFTIQWKIKCHKKR